MLKWVHQQGHPWGNVYWAAASEGRQHVLRWLNEHGVSFVRRMHASQRPHAATCVC